MVDLVTPLFKAGARASRVLPARVALGVGEQVLGRAAVVASSERRRMVARNLQRADPTLQGRALDRAVVRLFQSYARYWVESFRLPGTSAAVVAEPPVHLAGGEPWQAERLEPVARR